MVYKNRTVRPWVERKKGSVTQRVFSIYARPKFPETQASRFRTYAKDEAQLELVKDFLRQNGYYFTVKKVDKPAQAEVQVFNFQIQIGAI